MKPESLKLALDKIVAAIPGETDFTGHSPFRVQMYKDIKLLVEGALAGMYKEVAVYGTNTHSATAALAYLFEFRRIV